MNILCIYLQIRTLIGNFWTNCLPKTKIWFWCTVGVQILLDLSSLVVKEKPVKRWFYGFWLFCVRYFPVFQRRGRLMSLDPYIFQNQSFRPMSEMAVTN